MGEGHCLLLSFVSRESGARHLDNLIQNKAVHTHTHTHTHVQLASYSATVQTGGGGDGPVEFRQVTSCLNSSGEAVFESHVLQAVWLKGGSCSHCTCDNRAWLGAWQGPRQHLSGGSHFTHRFIVRGQGDRELCKPC